MYSRLLSFLASRPCMMFVSIMYVDIDDNGNDDENRDDGDAGIDDDADRDNDHGILKMMNYILLINTVMIKVVRIIYFLSIIHSSRRSINHSFIHSFKSTINHSSHRSINHSFIHSINQVILFSTYVPIDFHLLHPTSFQNIIS
jgi:hypothetical protein